MRKLVAVFCHVPGLRLFYGVRPGARILRQNALAVALTLVAMAAAAWLTPYGLRALAVLATWAVGHMLWGAFLAAGPLGRG